MMWNLDEMPEDELVETAEVLDQLARYARTRVQAMRFQAAGGKDRARHLERECERIYTHSIGFSGRGTATVNRGEWLMV
jgi:hypothetical protein